MFVSILLKIVFYNYLRALLSAIYINILFSYSI